MTGGRNNTIKELIAVDCDGLMFSSIPVATREMLGKSKRHGTRFVREEKQTTSTTRTVAPARRKGMEVPRSEVKLRAERWISGRLESDNRLGNVSVRPTAARQ